MLTNINGKPALAYDGEAPEVGKVHRFKAENGVTYSGKPVEVTDTHIIFEALTPKK